MKSVSSELLEHFGEDCTTLTVLWKAIRRDGTVFGFTIHDQDIVFEAVTYYAATGFTNSANDTKDDMSVDNLEVTGFLDSSAIDEVDIRAGLWNDATIEIRVVNWADLTMGAMKVRRGTTGTLKMMNGTFVAEIRGLTQKLSTVIGNEYGPLCRAELGSGPGGGSSPDPGFDAGNHYLCRVAIDTFRQLGSVNTVTDSTHIIPNSGLKKVGSATPTAPAPAGWFNDGILKFTEGPMNNFYCEIKDWDGTTLTLFLPMPFEPDVNDDFLIEPGCNKTIDDCFNKFNNIINFRGEPFIPGMDLISLYPNAK